ncbi:hypothetical protein [Paraburkholderia solisilvae]|uniref:Uncharacterized protein n=1 Tax=Paraburkholderia solisilvae TaxID=624376 RepID=A0A6J5D771_9BURK|nr:hypothetical protein [Paraburkholderia solisilvae]CAB3748735.1 hypothetical protein LMG29739_00579 [Paraburkholderia solisilvae]
MPADRIEITDDSPTQAPAYGGPAFGPFAPPASEAGDAAREATPIGFFTLGIAWLFGLEALLADERRR